MQSTTYRNNLLAVALSFGIGWTGVQAAPPLPPAATKPSGTAARHAEQQVAQSLKIVQTMQQEEAMRNVLQQAYGIFIVPKFTRASVGVGARGGEGVLLVKRDGQWTDPAFYNLGGLSAGIQAGVESGPLALVLTNEKAVNNFMQQDNVSLNAEAGLTLVDWSAKARKTPGMGDIIVWAGTRGLAGGVALSITDVRFDSEDTAAYYGKPVTLRNVVAGQVSTPTHANALKNALASTTGSNTAVGASSSGASAAGSGDAAPQPPVILLVPIEVVATESPMTKGCWAKIYDRKNFAGDTFTLIGPNAMSNMVGPFGMNWKNRVRSIELGPKATVTVFDNAGFKDQVAQFKPGQRVAETSKQMGFFDDFGSIKIACPTK